MILTREEAKERINNKHRNCTIKRVIDEIFDDFEKERRVQAGIRNERLLLIKERIEAEAVQKCHAMIKESKDVVE